jgi:hypothetical protein
LGGCDQHENDPEAHHESEGVGAGLRSKGRRRAAFAIPEEKYARRIWVFKVPLYIFALRIR